MTFNPRSAKAKGRALQNKIRDVLLEHFSEELEPDDIRSQVMGMSGEDIVLSPAARKLIPYSFPIKVFELIVLFIASLINIIDKFES